MCVERPASSTGNRAGEKSETPAAVRLDILTQRPYTGVIIGVASIGEEEVTHIAYDKQRLQGVVAKFRPHIDHTRNHARSV